MKVEILSGCRIDDETIAKPGDVLDLRVGLVNILVGSGKARVIKDDGDEGEEIEHPEGRSGILTSREPGAAIREPQSARKKR